VAKFEPGHKKLGGRKKGVGNKDKRQIREAINQLLDGIDVKKLYQDQKTPKDKANLIIGLLEYSIPKLNRTTIEGELKSDPTINVITNNPEEVQEFIEKLKDEDNPDV
jgi:hypothetical protein